MRKSFFVEIFLPKNLPEEQREALAQILSQLASRFSFLGFEDWEVTLSAQQKVLGVEREFYDLRQWKKPKPRMCAYFGKVSDAKIYQQILQKTFSELEVKAPRLLRPKDWMREWRKVYRPQKISGKTASLWIVPAWFQGRGKNSVFVNPGQAFGTGTHPTTRLCLQAFLDFSPLLPERAKILDFGAGTGVLAIAALVIGKNKKLQWRALAVETDPEGLKSCRENAKKNKVKLPVAKKIAKGEYDFVFANVLAPVLLAHKSELMRAVKSGGTLVLSGILRKEAKAFAKEFAPRKRMLLFTEGDWAALVIRKI
jgi:ribosomal protein L11 methyltransferase